MGCFCPVLRAEAHHSQFGELPGLRGKLFAGPGTPAATMKKNGRRSSFPAGKPARKIDVNDQTGVVRQSLVFAGGYFGCDSHSFFLRGLPIHNGEESHRRPHPCKSTIRLTIQPDLDLTKADSKSLI